MDKKSKSIIATTIFAIMLVYSFVNFVFLPKGFFIPTKNHTLAWINLIGMITTVVPLLILTISSFVYKRKNALSIVALVVYILSKIISPIIIGSISMNSLVNIIVVIVGFIILPSFNAIQKERKQDATLSEEKTDIKSAKNEKLKYYEEQYKDGIISIDELNQIKDSLQKK